MYSFDQLLKGIRDPYLAGMEINRLFSRKIFQNFRPKTDFFSQDWDNLIILDACRYDIFVESESLSQEVSWRWSDGSNSEEFIQFAINNNDLTDVVWVTANPWVSKYKDSIYKVLELWDGEWDNSLNTVPAESVVNHGINAVSEYPDKRLVIQFMQPHYPFIGDHSVSLPDHASFTGDGIRSGDETNETIWQQLRQGIVNKESVWKAYKANLEYVLPHVGHLVSELPGKTVVTSDHGNSFGSRAFPIPVRIYGHPPDLRYKSLVKVPWVEFSSSNRRDIRRGDIELDQNTSDIREERLQSLGYLNE